VLYITTVLIAGIYTYEVVELIFLIEANLSTNATLDKIIASSDVKVFKGFYSWTSSMLLMLFALALFIVFLMLNRTLKDNLLSQSTRRDK
jgi:hypothetical protein